MTDHLKEQISEEPSEVRKHFEFIDFLLFWKGKIDHTHLLKQFSISVPQAHTAIKKYKAFAPNNISYNHQEKHYWATEEFHPLIYVPNVENIVHELPFLYPRSDGDSWLESIPAIGMVSYPRRQINVGTLQRILWAMERQNAIEILYQSLRRIKPKWRWITPHALASDGFRWHVRAFCQRTHSYRDFVISRILEIRGSQSHRIEREEDEKWNHWVEVMIGPHPQLTPEQQEVIARDYGMTNKTRSISVRESMILYLLVLLRIDDEQIEQIRNPEEQQIILLNREELRPLLPA